MLSVEHILPLKGTHMKETNAKLETKRVIIYLCITFLMTIVYCVGIIYPLNNHADIRTAPSMTVQLLIAVVMFFPALGVVLIRHVPILSSSSSLQVLPLISRSGSERNYRNDSIYYCCNYPSHEYEKKYCAITRSVT